MNWKRPFEPESSGTGGEAPGADGKSAYRLAVENGFVGTEAEWLASLEGETGATGTQGSAGPGVAAGGSTGQVLSKTGAADYVTGWTDPATGAAMTDAEVLAALNRTTGPVSDTALGNRTADQTLVNPANIGPLSSLLSWLAGAVKGITGEADWKNVPATTLKTLKTRTDAHEGAGGVAHALATQALAGFLSVVDKAKLDGISSGAKAFGAVTPTGYAFNNLSMTANVAYTSDELRGVNGVPSDAVGVWVMMMAFRNPAGGSLYIDSADATPGGFSPRLNLNVAYDTVIAPVAFGTGTNTGKIKLLAGLNITGTYAWVVGWWR